MNPSSPIVTLMCMKSLRRFSLGLMARKPQMPSARPNHAGISAVGAGCRYPGTRPTQEQPTERAKTRVTFAKQYLFHVHGKDTSWRDASISRQSMQMDLQVSASRSEVRPTPCGRDVGSTKLKIALSLNPRRSALGKRPHLIDRGHGCVAGEGGQQRAMRPAQFDRIFRSLAGQQVHR